MREDVGHLKPKQKSDVFQCCSDLFILQGKKFRSEKVGLVFKKFAANSLRIF